MSRHAAIGSMATDPPVPRKRKIQCSYTPHTKALLRYHCNKTLCMSLASRYPDPQTLKLNCGMLAGVNPSAGPIWWRPIPPPSRVPASHHCHSPSTTPSLYVQRCSPPYYLSRRRSSRRQALPDPHLNRAILASSPRSSSLARPSFYHHDPPNCARRGHASPCHWRVLSSDCQS
jgi:hypothetical protein